MSHHHSWSDRLRAAVAARAASSCTLVPIRWSNPSTVCALGPPLVGGLAKLAVGSFEILRWMNPYQILRPQQQLRGNDSLLAGVDQSRLRTATGSLNDVNE